MSRGLILAGLGQGISNASTSVGNMMMRQNEEAARLAREEARDLRKEERTLRSAEEAKQRMIQEIAAAREGADQMGRERVAGQVLAAGGSRVAGDSPVMDRAEFANILKENPEYEQIYRKAGLVQDGMDPRMQRATDQYEAAAAAGASSATLEALEKMKRSVLETIKEENREKKADADRALSEKRFEATIAVQRQNADANTTRANRPPSGGYDPNRPATTADLQRQVTAAENMLAQKLGVPKANINSQIAALRRRAENGSRESQSRLAELEPLIQQYNDANQRMLEFKRTPSSNSGDNRQTSDRPPLGSFMRQ